MAQNDSRQKQFSEEVQHFIVTRLACKVKAAKVQQELVDIFDLADVSLSRILYYDPTKPQGFKLEASLKKLFVKTRTAFFADAQAAPCFHLAYRLHFIQDMLDDESNERNPFLLKDLLKQAAQEAGGIFKQSGSAPDVDEQIERFVAELAAPRQAKTAETSERGD